MTLTKQKINDTVSLFLNSDTFIFFYSVFVLGVSFLDCNGIILSVILLACALIFFTQKNLKPLFVPLTLSYFSIRFIEGKFVFDWFFFFSAAIFLLSIIWYIARNKPSFRPTGNLKAIFPYAAAYVLAGSFAADYFTDKLFYEQLSMLALLVPSLAFFVLLAANSFFDHPEYVFKILFAMGAVVSLQMFLTAATTEHFWDTVFVEDTVTLNWGVYNGIVTALLFSVPACFYLAAKHIRVCFLFVTAGFLFTLAGFFTASRASAFTLAPLLLLCFFAALFATEKKDRIKIVFSFLVCFAAAIVGIAVFSMTFRSLVNDLIGALTVGGFNLGRDKVWAESIRFFLENPLFGLGLMHHHDVQQGGVVYGFWLSHNSIYQAFSSLGLFGFITLMIHNIYKYKTFLKADLFSFFGLIALIGTELYGLIDCLMPAPYYVFPLLLLIFSADRVNLQNEKKLPLKKTFR